MSFLDVLGYRVGFFTVVAVYCNWPKGAKKNRPFVLLKCKCGYEKGLLYQDVRIAKRPRCPQCLYPKEGDRIGLLTFVSFLHGRYQGRSNRYGVFKCDCGKVAKIAFSSIRRGDSKSCGCLLMKRLKDRSGSAEKVGKVINGVRILKILIPEKGLSRFVCRCSCGKKFECSTKEVWNSRPSFSCGCKKFKRWILNPQKAAEIRDMARGGYKAKQIAEFLEVKQSAVRNVLMNRTYKKIRPILH